MNGAQAIIKTLEDFGIKTIYGYPGGAVLPLYDALLDSEKIEHILVRQEQAAAHAANGASRSSSLPGVCLTTSGPGATNLVTGIANAYMDSIPIICLTGQVTTDLIGSDAFQETDIIGITLPIVKHSYLVKDAELLPQILSDAFHIARTGRPGPVLIDIPKDVQMAEIEYKKPEKFNIQGYKPNLHPNKKQVKKVAQALKEAERPLFLVGGGVVNAGAYKTLRKIIEKVKVPVVSTLMGLGTIDHSDPMYFGMVGLHGRACANFALSRCDLLINLGARFDDRTTINAGNFAPNARIVHVDIDPAEIGKNIDTQVPIVSDIKNFLDVFIGEVHEEKEDSDWVKQLIDWNNKYPLTYQDDGSLKPQYIIEKLSELTDGKAYIATDVGQHQMWTAQFYKFREPKRLITSGGLGTMGYGLPAAIGIKRENPDEMVIDITGDGSFQMNFAEIATALEHDLPIKIILFNNNSLSLVRQLQYFAQDKRYSGIDFKKNPDFCKLVKAYPGTEAYRIERNDQVEDTLRKALNNDKLTLVECMTSNEERVYPVANGKEGLTGLTYMDDLTINPFE